MVIKKVLIVDDSPTMLRILSNTLGKCGYDNIIQAENGKAALAKLKSEGDINIILSDWNMPEMNGLEFLQAVRADGELKALPFIMVTSRSVKSDVIEAIKNGANSYIAKPFTMEAIQEKINEVIA